MFVRVRLLNKPRYSNSLSICKIFRKDGKLYLLTGRLSIVAININLIKNEDDIYSFTEGDIINLRNFGYSLISWINNNKYYIISTRGRFTAIKYGKYLIELQENAYSDAECQSIEREYTLLSDDDKIIVCEYMKKYKICLFDAYDLFNRFRLLSKHIRPLSKHKCILNSNRNRKILVRSNKTSNTNIKNLTSEEMDAIRDIMHHEKLNFGYAYNIFIKKYSIEFAKRLQYLKNRELSGKSNDAFSIGYRVSGSFGSGKQ